MLTTARNDFRTSTPSATDDGVLSTSTPPAASAYFEGSIKDNDKKQGQPAGGS